MFNLFKEIINLYSIIEDKKLKRILSNFELKEIKKGTILVNQGDICKHFYIIIYGCVRNYYISEKGELHTRRIAFENAFITVLTSFISQKPAVEYLETLEDSKLLIINYYDFNTLINSIPEWEIFYRKILEDAFLFQNKRIENLLSLSALEYYNKILSDTPFYFQRLSNKVIASYLNITQETLSRLKSK